MGLFGKSAQQKRIDSDALVIADLTTKLKAANKEIAETGVLLTAACDGRDIACRQNAHFRADNHRMESALRDIAKMATPSCAHIGRKMAARAREVLPVSPESHLQAYAAPVSAGQASGVEVLQ